MKQLTAFFFLPLLVFSLGCKKISTPTKESNALFGSWKYLGSSGGFSGGGSTTISPDSWLEFTNKGVMRVYEGSNKECQKRFKIELKESIYSADLRTAIVYLNGQYETFQIINDTLYISDEDYDGYMYQYARKE